MPSHPRRAFAGEIGWPLPPRPGACCPEVTEVTVPGPPPPICTHLSIMADPVGGTQASASRRWLLWVGARGGAGSPRPVPSSPAIVTRSAALRGQPVDAEREPQAPGQGVTGHPRSFQNHLLEGGSGGLSTKQVSQWGGGAPGLDS